MCASLCRVGVRVVVVRGLVLRLFRRVLLFRSLGRFACGLRLAVWVALSGASVLLLWFEVLHDFVDCYGEGGDLVGAWLFGDFEVCCAWFVFVVPDGVAAVE
jgi:hypothetical protein